MLERFTFEQLQVLDKFLDEYSNWIEFRDSVRSALCPYLITMNVDRFGRFSEPLAEHFVERPYWPNREHAQQWVEFIQFHLRIQPKMIDIWRSNPTDESVRNGCIVLNEKTEMIARIDCIETIVDDYFPKSFWRKY